MRKKWLATGAIAGFGVLAVQVLGTGLLGTGFGPAADLEGVGAETAPVVLKRPGLDLMISTAWAKESCCCDQGDQVTVTDHGTCAGMNGGCVAQDRCEIPGETQQSGVSRSDVSYSASMIPFQSSMSR